MKDFGINSDYIFKKDCMSNTLIDKIDMMTNTDIDINK